MSEAKSVAHYLEVQATPSEQARVSERLLEVGCVAIEEKPNGWVLAYAETDAALREFARVSSVEVGADRVHELPLDPNWELAFAESLEPVQLTARLWVAPANNTGAVPPSVDCLLLEPAFAFGFGEHATTRLIARWLEKAVTARANASVLDFGCGTGILALASLFFGAREALGLDIDSRAVDAARSNARLNGFDARCGFSCDSLAKSPSFDVVVANVDAATLVHCAASLATRMSVGGALALTGFLSEDVAAVSQALEPHGVRVREIATDGDWALVANWATDD